MQRAIVAADLSQIIGATLRCFDLAGDLEEGFFIEGLNGHCFLSAGWNHASLLNSASLDDERPDGAVRIFCFFQKSRFGVY